MTLTPLNSIFSEIFNNTLLNDSDYEEDCQLKSFGSQREIDYPRMKFWLKLVFVFLSIVYDVVIIGYYFLKFIVKAIYGVCKLFYYSNWKVLKGSCWMIKINYKLFVFNLKRRLIIL